MGSFAVTWVIGVSESLENVDYCSCLKPANPVLFPALKTEQEREPLCLLQACKMINGSILNVSLNVAS